MKQKTSILFALALCVCCDVLIPSVAQAQNFGYHWASSSEDGSCFSTKNATDAAGNTYVSGSFLGPDMVFGSVIADYTGNFDFFIVKFGPDGVAQWARTSGNSDIDTGTDVAVDPDGNVIAVGWYSGASMTLGSEVLTNAGPELVDAFIVKYDPDGNVLWARSSGGANDDQHMSVCTDPSGNIIVTGAFESTTITFGSTTLTHDGLGDAYVVKYDPDGNVLWANDFGNQGAEFGYRVAADMDGNIVFSGSFEGSQITIGPSTLNQAGLGDEYIAKCDPDGTVLWADAISSSDLETIYSIDTDSDGQIYVVGQFESSSLTIGSTTLTNSGSVDMFVAAYTLAGGVVWAKSAGGTSPDRVQDIHVDDAGYLVAVGTFGGADMLFDGTVLQPIGSSDGFLAKYVNASGDFIWAKAIGGSFNDDLSGISADADGDMYMSGYFESDPLTLGSITVPNSGGNNSDMLLFKYGPCAMAEGIVTVSGSPCIDCIVRAMDASSQTSQWVTAFETTTDAVGTYAVDFPQDVEGTIMVLPDPANHPNAFTTFNGDTYVWEEAVTIVNTCPTALNVDIAVVDVPSPGGTGTISGEVYYAPGKQQAEEPVPLIDVVVERVPPGNSISTHGQTDVLGTFQLLDLPILSAGEHYRMYVSYPGIPMADVYSIVISSEDTVIPNMDFMVDLEANLIFPVGIGSGVASSDDDTGHLWIAPNPMNDRMQVDMGNRSISAVSYRVIDQLGKVVMHQAVPSMHTFEVGRSGMPPGVYLLEVQTEDGGLLLGRFAAQ